MLTASALIQAPGFFILTFLPLEHIANKFTAARDVCVPEHCVWQIRRSGHIPVWSYF